MSREHTFVDDPVAVIERGPSKREQEQVRWHRFTVYPYTNEILEQGIGHPVDSLYVERFWLPIIGPTPLLLMRNLARRVKGADVVLDGLASEVGCKTEATAHALSRAERFSLLRLEGTTLYVSRYLAPLTLRQFGNLPAHLRVDHSLFVEPSS